jgi:hypothetical protein
MDLAPEGGGELVNQIISQPLPPMSITFLCAPVIN